MPRRPLVDRRPPGLTPAPGGWTGRARTGAPDRAPRAAAAPAARQQRGRAGGAASATRRCLSHEAWFLGSIGSLLLARLRVHNRHQTVNLGQVRVRVCPDSSKGMARVVAAGQENLEELGWEAASVNDEAIP